MKQQQIKQHFNAAATGYDTHAFVQREVAQRLVSHFDGIKLQPKTILDLGCSTGFTAKACASRFRNANVIGIDIAEALLRQCTPDSRLITCCANAMQLPLASDSVDCVISNMMLQWCNFDEVFAEVARVLKTDGLWLFSTLGPTTLYECRESWSKVDERPHVHAFTDCHLLGDACVNARLIEPVMDVETLTLHYRSLNALMQDIRGIGAHNTHPERRNTLTGRRRFQAFAEHYRAYCTDGAYPLTYEVIYGHAFKAAPQQTATLNEHGEARFPLAYLRQRR